MAGTAGYLAPISCDNFYNYAWWVRGIHCHWHCSSSMLRPLWSGWVHKWRMGLIGLLIPLVVLLQYTW